MVEPTHSQTGKRAHRQDNGHEDKEDHEEVNANASAARNQAASLTNVKLEVLLATCDHQFRCATEGGSHKGFRHRAATHARTDSKVKEG